MEVVLFSLLRSRVMHRQQKTSLITALVQFLRLVIHPASNTNYQLNEEELLDKGIKPNTIRLSIGTENIADIIEDLEEAFKAVK